MAHFKQESKNELNQFLEHYLSKMRTKNLEFEIRFGTKGQRFIKDDIDNIVRKLLSEGFNVTRNNEYTLKISNEFIDASGETRRTSNIRTEVSGIHNIRKYCKMNVLSDVGTYNFLRKKRERLTNLRNPHDVSKYNLRYSLEEEEVLSENSGEIQTIMSSWSDNKKTFRLINRLEMEHPQFPFRIDISTVKSSRRLKGGDYEYHYTIEESNVFFNRQQYEVEIELLNDKVRSMYQSMIQRGVPEKDLLKQLEGQIKMGIRYVLSGIQQSNFPITLDEGNKIFQDYLNLVGLGDRKYKSSSLFIGPSTVTLQKINLIEDENQKTPTVLKDYTVTEKADGMRKFMYIAKNGKIYLISMNLQVQFTGCVSMNSNLYNSLFDGEHVLYSKTKKLINMYLCFDAYFIQGKDIRKEAFIENVIDEKKVYRLKFALESFKNLKIKYVSPQYSYNLKTRVKDFYLTNEENGTTIFDICKDMVKMANDKDYYPYETDGIVFTPQYLGVGMNDEKDKPKLYKKTWKRSFKWKPPEYNTIDFLVDIEKSGGSHVVKVRQTDGVSMGKSSSLSYKTLYLKVGYNLDSDGYVNPQLDILEGMVEQRIKEQEESNDYENGPRRRSKQKPGLFYPTSPYDNKAHICNVELKHTSSGDKELMTEEGDLIEDNTIVEFKYVKENEDMWKWVPLRVRYDKTNELRTKNSNFGNAYLVANSNWQSIHNPITEEMLSTGNKIYLNSSDDDVYYNKKDTQRHGYKRGEQDIDSLRTFHNSFVKRVLIQSYSNEETKLMDFAVGKAGDFPKWIHSKINFVYGIDISRDNIENKLDGACARYINYRKQYDKMAKVIFLQGDASKDLLQGQGFFDERSPKIQLALLGAGTKDKSIIGKGVYDLYGIAENMFDVTSMQFALHYMFKDVNSLHTFMKNVSNFTKIGGHFIGTCFDGKRLFTYLEGVERGESKTIMIGERKFNSITKHYEQTEFRDDSSSVGYAISVYQESINKYIQEYLVNFDYLIEIMSAYGFKVTTSPFNKSRKSIGGFEELFNLLTQSEKMNEEYKGIEKMTPEEKTISFMNNYFVFMKSTEVDVEAVYHSFVDKHNADAAAEE